MIELKSTPAEDRKMVDLFSIDGRVYQMPVKVGAAVALGYMRYARTHGQEAAMGWALEQVLGEEAYLALMACPDLEPEDLEAVMKVVHDNVMGAVEVPKGKRKHG